MLSVEDLHAGYGRQPRLARRDIRSSARRFSGRAWTQRLREDNLLRAMRGTLNPRQGSYGLKVANYTLSIDGNSPADGLFATGFGDPTRFHRS